MFWNNFLFLGLFFSIFSLTSFFATIIIEAVINIINILHNNKDITLGKEVIIIKILNKLKFKKKESQSSSS